MFGEENELSADNGFGHRSDCRLDCWHLVHLASPYSTIVARRQISDHRKIGLISYGPAGPVPFSERNHLLLRTQERQSTVAGVRLRWQAGRMTDEEIREQLERQNRQLRSTAYHEAGHAVIAFVLGHWVGNITIVPGDDILSDERGESLGVQSYLGRVFITDAHSYEQALFAIAGPVAQKQFGNPKPWKETPDYFMLVRALKEFKAAHGFKSVNQYAETLVELMVKQNWELITALAEHLLVVKEMDRDAARDFLLAAHQRLIREAHYPPEPVFDGLDAYEAWIEKHKEKLDDLKQNGLD